MSEIRMPALSPTMEEGKLAKWHVAVGDSVRVGDLILEVETDKATMEVEAERDGIVSAIVVGEGTEGVKVDAILAHLGGAVIAASSAAPPPASTPGPKVDPILSPAARRIVEENRLDAGAISGSGRDGRVTKGDALEALAAPSPAKVAGGGRIFASPLARRLAEQKGIDLAGVTGSGPHGRIIKLDIDKAGQSQPAAPQAASQARAGVAAPAAAPRQAQSLEQMGIAPGSYELIPLDGMRKTVARRMTDSFRDVPHFPLTIDIEIDALLAARVKINAMLEKQGVKVSVNDMVLKAAAVALMRVPEANASYTPEGIAMHRHADIAMAVAVPGGLITPIIRACETKGLAQIATEAKDLAERARTKKLKPEEFQGGTFSVSNLGMFGIKTFSSIVNEPQGAILSVGVGEKRPVVRGDELAIATVMSVTLTCDHRVVDGATGAKWLAAFKPLIEDPLAMIV